MEINSLITQILLGIRPIYSSNFEEPLLGIGPTGKTKFIKDLSYERFYNEFLKEGIPTKKELEKSLMFSGTWTHVQEKKLKDLKNEKKRLSKELIANKYKIALKKKVEKQLFIVNKKYNELLNQKISLFSLTAENLAEEHSLYDVIHELIYYNNNEKVWKSKEDLELSDKEIVQEIINSYMRDFYIPIVKIRKIARNGYWRIYYTHSKNATDLFSKKMVDLDVNQINLLYWSSVYDSAINSYEPPSDDILNNDDSFDAWLDDQAKKYKKIGSSKINKKSKAAGKNQLVEDFIFADDEGAKVLQEELGDINK